MNAKERAVQLYQQHIALASTDGRLFRKTVMDTLMAETGCSITSAATHYNNAKKANPVEGLGRAPAPAGLVKAGGTKKSKTDDPDVDDDDCFAVIELVNLDGEQTVGRYQSFILQGDASEKFDEKVVNWPARAWVMIKGLGPNHGNTFKLGTNEKIIKQYNPDTKLVTA